MEYSKKFKEVLDFYKNNFWSERMVRNAVIKNWITESEFKEITGKQYKE